MIVVSYLTEIYINDDGRGLDGAGRQDSYLDRCRLSRGKLGLCQL
jgi:hypothetical protein